MIIEHLRHKVSEKEDELIRLKETINGLSEDAGLDKPYPNVRPEGSVGDISAIRADQFYGQPLSTAIRTYLEMRKASGFGAASLGEIHNAVRTGGFAFNTRDEENAKTSVRLTLRKNSSVFHRLPNGEYGLLAWYPGAKEQKQMDDNGSETPGRRKLIKAILKSADAKSTRGKTSKGEQESKNEEV